MDLLQVCMYLNKEICKFSTSYIAKRKLVTAEYLQLVFAKKHFYLSNFLVEFGRRFKAFAFWSSLSSLDFLLSIGGLKEPMHFSKRVR